MQRRGEMQGRGLRGFEGSTFKGRGEKGGVEGRIATTGAQSPLPQRDIYSSPLVYGGQIE